jgi:predicted TIM-barrel fold metal-dependent hydrolase
MAEGFLQVAGRFARPPQCPKHRAQTLRHGFSSKMESANQRKPSDFSRYFDSIVEALTLERLMVGSDWQVCLLSRDNAYRMQIVIDYVPAVQTGVLGRNRERFYGINS